MKPTLLSELIYNILLKHDAPGVTRKHTADVIAQHVQYHVNERVNTFVSEKREWDALAAMCKEAKVSVTVFSEGGFNVVDDQTEQQTNVDTKEEVIHILNSRIQYLKAVSGYNWM